MVRVTLLPFTDCGPINAMAAMLPLVDAIPLASTPTLKLLFKIMVAAPCTPTCKLIGHPMPSEYTFNYTRVLPTCALVLHCLANAYVYTADPITPSGLMNGPSTVSVTMRCNITLQCILTLKKMFLGTCVTTLFPSCYGSSYTKYEDVTDYFTQVLALRAQYDLYTALANANITPGSSYDVSDIQAAIQTAFGVTAKIDCSSGTLIDVEINFLVQGTSTYVPQNTSGSTCSGSVYYPTK